MKGEQIAKLMEEIRYVLQHVQHPGLDRITMIGEVDKQANAASCTITVAGGEELELTLMDPEG